MLPPEIQSLIHQFTKLPGIGPRQAARFVFYLLRNQEEISSLVNTLQFMRAEIKLCPNCFLPASFSCGICANPKRDAQTICVVEKETDALNLEKTGHFQGHYYILGGFIDPLQQQSIARERLAILKEKLRLNDKPLEIILALTPRREGHFTSLAIEKQLKPLCEQGVKIKITLLGRGLSSGAELEYADEETLRNALEGRR